MKKIAPKTPANDFNKAHFIFIEFCIFISQVAVIFFVAFLISHMFSNETRFTEFISGKLNAQTTTELGLTLLAVTFVLGVLAILKQLEPSSLLEKIVNEVISELPRTIYLFGSSITAISLSIAVYAYIHPQETLKPLNFFAHAAFFALSFFTYGCLLKYYFLPKSVRQIASKSKDR
jgi:magnesium-transporting ATPase (P-type)